MTEQEMVASELLNRLARYGRVYLLDSVPSTNDYALSLARRKEPAIIVARRQTKGRGRFRRRWFADENSLIFSLLFFPGTNFPSPAILTQIAGLALCRAIETITGTGQPAPLLRWPNDVLINERKVAGILCEQRKDAIIIGVGVNLNQAALPENLSEASSLFLAYGNQFDRFSILDIFLPEFFNSVELVAKGNAVPVWDEIKRRSAILHHRVEIRTLLHRVIGTVIDIDDAGRIILRTDSGRLMVFNAGQVRQLR
ncbi:MAG: biotin--[acetyl-CoA-carboxylase] ligase [bacterium]